LALGRQQLFIIIWEKQSQQMKQKIRQMSQIHKQASSIALHIANLLLKGGY
jgi:hypothetical protein